MKIIIDGRQIDFDGPLNFVLNSPMFNDQTTYSFPFTVKASVLNADILGNPEVIAVKKSDYSLSCTIIAGSFQISGSIKIQKATHAEYQLYFIGQSDYATLTEMNLTNITFETDANPLASGKICQPPVYNSLIAESFPYIPGYPIINNRNLNGVLTTGIDDDEEEGTGKVFVHAYYCQLRNVIDNIFHTIGLNVTRSIFGIYTDLQQLFIYNNWLNSVFSFTENYHWWSITRVYIDEDDRMRVNMSGEHPVNKWEYIKITNTGRDELDDVVFRILAVFNDGGTGTVDHIIIEYLGDIDTFIDLGSGESEVGIAKDLLMTETQPTDRNKFLPNVTIKEFMAGLEKFLGFVTFYSESSRSVKMYTLKELMNSSRHEDITIYASDKYNIVPVTYDGYSLSFTGDSNDSYYAEKVVEPDWLIYTYKGEVDDFDDLPASPAQNDLYLVLNKNNDNTHQYYAYNTTKWSGKVTWQFITIERNMIFNASATNNLEIQSTFGPVIPAIINNDAWIPYDMIMLRAEQLNNGMIIDETTEFTPRLFFYRGTYQIRQNNNPLSGYPQPLATNDVYDHLGNKIATANLALRWDGEYGIYNFSYREWLNWNLNVRKDVTRTIYWPISLLHDFDFTRKYVIAGVSYFVKSIKFSIGENDKITFGDTDLAML